jgi:hypothetical protein
VAASELSNSDDLTLQLLELEQRAGQIARQLVRLRERPIFVPDDISERQAAELDKRLLHIRAEMTALRAAQR